MARSSLTFGASLSDPNYKEGFGKDASGGGGRHVCTVRSSAASGARTLDACFQPGDRTSNVTIVFTVPTVTVPWTRYIGSNVTIDGCANGMNGVTMDATDGAAKKSLAIEDPASNIVIRCINFRGAGAPNSRVAEANLLTVDGGNGSRVSNVFIDRCTFWQASNKALDLVGNVSNVTVQRSLFYGNALTMLIKYQTRQNISIHHNVFTRNGERHPQVKGDMRLIDYVNNVVYRNDVRNYPDGSSVDAYGVRIWAGNSASDSPGNPVGNFVANAFIGEGSRFELIQDKEASLAGAYIRDNHCSPASRCPASPAGAPNAVPAPYAVTTLTTDQLSTMLPYVGAPNRTALDQQQLNDVAAVLPGSGAPHP